MRRHATKHDTSILGLRSAYAHKSLLGYIIYLDYESLTCNKFRLSKEQTYDNIGPDVQTGSRLCRCKQKNHVSQDDALYCPASQE